MENRLKERLTGAAILVALVVMLVPEMFHGQRGDVATIAGSSGEGPPVRSYTIDLSNSPTRAGPLQSPPVGGGSGSNDDKPTTVPAPEQPTAVTTTAADGAVTASRLAAAAAAPSHGAQGGWGVQLGLFAKRDNAERLAHAPPTPRVGLRRRGGDCSRLASVVAR